MKGKRNFIHSRDLIQPFFVLSGRKRRNGITGMPGIFRMSCDLVTREIESLIKNGVNTVLLFGVAQGKDPNGVEASDPQGAVQNAVRELKKRFGKDITVITDVCLCGFTDHGHCGILKGFRIDIQKTLLSLGTIAVSHARSGADFVAPSAMTQGQVKSVRDALDRAGFNKTGIWAYAVKYASSFYGPFRYALDSAPKFGDRKAYQMDPQDTLKAITSALSDEKNGADILMVKPALLYLDIIAQLKQKAKSLVAAYHVSGEYGVLKAGANQGVIDEKSAVLETLLSIHRAGADKIVTYYAKEAARWLK